MNTIMLVASVSFYKHLLEIEALLEKRGFSVKIPIGAQRLKGGLDPLAHKEKFLKEKNWKEKRSLIEENFRTLLACDAILVINDEKNGYNSMEEYEKSQIKVDGDILNKLC